MKKIISIFMTLILVFGFAACKTRKVDLAEVQKHEGTLLVIHCIPSGEMTLEEFESSQYTSTVSYSGYANIPNPINPASLKMSDEDFLTIYNFCLDCYETNKYADYKEDACDGTQYSFTFIDENGTRHLLYSGYIYGCEELTNILNTVGNYSID